MSSRVNAKLYKIQDLIIEKYQDTNVLISEMVEKYYLRSDNRFKEINLNNDVIFDNNSARLFVFSAKRKKPIWLEFLNEIVESPDSLNDLDVKYSSFILFNFYQNKIYVVTKGYHGHHLLADYIDRFFGLEVLSRLIDKNATEIKQIEERGLFGVEVGAQRFFRENYNLSYEDDFGKIYKTMLASIDEHHFEKLGVIKKRQDTNSVSAYGSASFEVSTNFDYKELIQRIKKISELLNKDGVKFNQFYRLSHNELSAIKDDLNNALLEQTYKSFQKKESVEFYHPDVFNYLRSNELRFNVQGDFLEIPYGSSMSIVEIIELLVSKGKIDDTSKNSFIVSLRNCYGGFKLSEDSEYTNEMSLNNWINGEVELNSHRFFKVDNTWYRYREGFDDYLNSFFSEFDFDKISPKLTLSSWNTSETSKEGDYNKSFIDEDDFIICDKVLVSNIEICDLIRITKDEIFLYHVKKGLGRDLRVLSNQIINSSRILTNAIHEGKNETLSLYYKGISKKHYDNLDIGSNTKYTEDEFIDLIKTKNIVYVFAYSSSSNKNIKDELLATNSRIAKLSLIYCLRDMRRVNSSFMIERIKEIKS